MRQWFTSSRVTTATGVVVAAVAVAALILPFFTRPSLGAVQKDVRILKQRITILKASNAQVRAEFDRVQATQSRNGVKAAAHVLAFWPGSTPAFRTKLKEAGRLAATGDRLYAKRRWAAAESVYEKAAGQIVANCPARLAVACAVLLGPGTPLTFAASPFP